MPRRGIAVAVIVIVACIIVLGLTSDFLVDWAWFSAIGYLDVFGTILGGKAILFFAVSNPATFRFVSPSCFLFPFPCFCVFVVLLIFSFIAGLLFLRLECCIPEWERS